MPRPLSYLLFDATDEDSGACSFDAMACVLPDRFPALLAEVQTVLIWATRAFGPPAATADDGDTAEWMFDLQATDQAGAPLAITWDPEQTHVQPPQVIDGRITLTLTVSGSPAFAAAFREAFADMA